MQPYFFPYLDYFRLIAASDCFVFYDDVQYSKGGWINRNRILRGGKACWLTLPVQRGALSLTIRERLYRLDNANAGRLLRQVESAYRKAPQFGAVFPLLREIVDFPDPNVAAFNTNLVRRISSALGVETPLLRSSAIDKSNELAGQPRVIDICKRLGATRYVNAIGGVGLYDADLFAHHGIELRFIKSDVLPYRQDCPGFVPNLSIIDTMMFNSRAMIGDMLRQYRLAPG